MRSVFFYGGALGLLFGIVGAILLLWSYAEVLFLLVCAISLWLVRVIKKNASHDSVFLPLLIVACVTCAIGVVRVTSETVSPYADIFQKKVLLHGTIVREPDIRNTTVHLTVEPYDKTEYVRVTTTRYSTTTFAYGDEVEIKGILSRAESFETDSGRMFPYEGYLKAQGIGAVIGFADVIKVSDGDISFTRTLYKGKEHFLNTLGSVLPEPHAGLASGILLGVKQALGESLDAIFRETGITHIVVLSGYNIMIVVTLVGYILSYILPFRMRIVGGMLCIFVFALLVGFSATVVRASCMAALALLAHMTGRTYQIMRALTLVGVGMVVWNPYILVYDPGFQLSFLATLGLILFASRLEKRFTYIPTFLGLRNMLAATISAQVAVFPLILYYSGVVSLSAVLVNGLVLPMVPWAMILTALTGFLGSIPLLGKLVGFGAFLSLEYIIKIPTWFASLPFSSVTIEAIPFSFVMALYGGYIVIYMYLKSRFEEKSTTQNDYADWTIEEEKDNEMKVPESRSDSGTSSPLPFR